MANRFSYSAQHGRAYPIHSSESPLTHIGGSSHLSPVFCHLTLQPKLLTAWTYLTYLLTQEGKKAERTLLVKW